MFENLNFLIYLRKLIDFPHTTTRVIVRVKILLHFSVSCTRKYFLRNMRNCSLETRIIVEILLVDLILLTDSSFSPKTSCGYFSIVVLREEE